MNEALFERGFLPRIDPAQAFPTDWELSSLDRVGHDLPSLLIDSGFRQYARELKIPAWPEPEVCEETLPLLRLYYLRLGFLASAYINQVAQPQATLLPGNIASPLCHAARLLERPPILSYDGYALYNWKRFRPDGPIALGNIDTLQNFVHLYDEHWFILVHVEIEAIAARILAAIERAEQSRLQNDSDGVNQALRDIGGAVWQQVGVLKRIPEHMDPSLYYKTFRPYIRFFENVIYEGVETEPLNFRGETGAQSSVVPAIVAFMKIEHQQSQLTDHLLDMQRFMPAEHRFALARIQALPSIRPLAEKDPYNDVLEALASFRQVHFNWAHEYINKWVDDPRGTGGTPYMTWLNQLVKETLAHKIE